MKRSKKLLIAILIPVLLVAIGMAVFVYQQPPREPDTNNSPPLTIGANGRSTDLEASRMADAEPVENDGNNENRKRATPTAKPLAEFQAVIRDPDSISQLFNAAAEGSNIGKGLAADQLLTARSVCSSYLNTPRDAGNPLRRAALERLEKFCDMEPEVIEESLSEFESTGYFEVMETVSADMEFNDVNGAINRIRRYIAQANRFGEIATAAAWLVELEYRAEPKPGIIATDGISWRQAQLAASDAAMIYFCLRLGGCDMNHFLTASFCAEEGCEKFITDIEQAILRSRSPRHFELVRDLLAFFYS